MQVTVQGYLTLKLTFGRRVFELANHPPPTLQDLFTRLQSDFALDLPAVAPGPQAGRPAGALILLLNGQHLSHLPTGLQTPLKDGDVLSIFPPIAGG
jgi:molybdopterin synthase sulfur carrier subunit